MNVSIIGAGAMGGAIARGLVSGGLSPDALTVSNPSPGRLAGLAECGMRTTTDNREACRAGDIIVLAVKPWIVPEVVREIKDRIDYARQTLCVVAAGVSGSDLCSWLERDGRLPAMFLVMPNTAVAVGESMTFIVPVEGADAVEVTRLFGLLGHVMVTEERLLPAATSLASCGIAYAMRYVRAATEGGVELGFKASAAQEIVVQTLRGAAALLSLPGAHPETEIDKVTTPGGLTIRGLNEMEHAGFTSAVIRGLKAGTPS